MRTTFSAVALCLVLCVVGNFAARMDRSLKQDQPSTSCRGTGGNNRITGIRNPSFRKAVADVSNGLCTATEQLDNNVDINTVSKEFAVSIAGAFAQAISKTMSSIEFRVDQCLFLIVKGLSFSTTFSDSVSAAFDQSSNTYIRAYRDCFSQAVRNVPEETLPELRPMWCRDTTSTDVYNFLLKGFSEGFFDSGWIDVISSAVNPVFLAYRYQDLSAAKQC